MFFKYLSISLLIILSIQNAYSQDHYQITSFEKETFLIASTCYNSKNLGAYEHQETCRTVRQELNNLSSKNSPLSHDEKNVLNLVTSSIEQALARSLIRIRMEVAKKNIRISNQDYKNYRQLSCDHYRNAFEHYLKIEPPTRKWFDEISANRSDLTIPINSCNKHGY